jgi:hypothetical protein
MLFRPSILRLQDARTELDDLRHGPWLLVCHAWLIASCLAAVFGALANSTC